MQSQGVGSSVKHFAVNNQETDRMRVSADVDERTLREIYFPAFERIVTQERPATVMCSYNKVNGTFAAESRLLLTQGLREEWDFDGLVVSDWGPSATASQRCWPGPIWRCPATATAPMQRSPPRCAPARWTKRSSTPRSPDCAPWDRALAELVRVFTGCRHGAGGSPSPGP
ncbi:glycoside hydrolase family 3 N-terminal domain-containing protein [Streptomyces mirabilis]|uniref:glycoside hydrolase family 3 N-terminal domain-containing protein n=1 Tax=Streptomyces mirabilis TaxID=68239 RepID=UPI003F7523E9